MKTSSLVLASLLASAIAHTASAEEPAHVAALESPEAAGPDVAAGIPVIPATPAAAEADPSSKDFRIGFWELDLFAVDHEARGTTYRFFDFKIFKLLEVGQGPTYQAFSFFEVPDLLNVFTSRRDGADSETRVMDIQALSLALARQTSESEGSSGDPLHEVARHRLGGRVRDPRRAADGRGADLPLPVAAQRPALAAPPSRRHPLKDASLPPIGWT